MAKRCDIVSARDFRVQVCEALGLVPMTVRRIIIDIDSEDMNAPLPVYVEMVGDKDILSLDWNQGLLRVVWGPGRQASTPHAGDTKVFCYECSWKGTASECLSDQVSGLRCPICKSDKISVWDEETMP